MGLIKAALGALGGTLADQWKEFFYCDALDNETLVVKGQKLITGRSSNTKGNDNIISNGSGIAVADGQCMIIVDDGKVVELCAEPGRFTYDTSTSPSIFAGNLGQSILDTFKELGRRFTYGGDPGKDQRVYYFNTKEIADNKFGTANPVPFKVVINEQLGYKLSVDLKCNGTYSYKIADPILFYTNVCGNVASSYTRDQIEMRLKSELIDALQPSLAVLSANGVSYDQIPAHTGDLKDALNEALQPLWGERGLEVYRVNMGVPSIPEEQRKKITAWEETAMTTDPRTAGARLVGGQIDAMNTAAGNTAGAMTGFMGVGMAMNMGGNQASNFYGMAQQGGEGGWTCPNCGKSATGRFCANCGTKKPEPEAAENWVCPTCGKTATGNFCGECGTKKPGVQEGWTCECGKVNLGRFCTDCGKSKPADAPLYRCDKCGWMPEDPKNPPKFCPRCGDVFDDHDVQ